MDKLKHIQKALLEILKYILYHHTHFYWIGIPPAYPSSMRIKYSSMQFLQFCVACHLLDLLKITSLKVSVWRVSVEIQRADCSESRGWECQSPWLCDCSAWLRMYTILVESLLKLLLSPFSYNWPMAYNLH